MTGTTGIWVSAVNTDSPAGELAPAGPGQYHREDRRPVDRRRRDDEGLLRHPPSATKTYYSPRRSWAMPMTPACAASSTATSCEVIESLGTVIEEETGPLEDTGEEYSEFVQISDDSGTITVEVPVEWGDVNGEPVTLDDGTELQNVSAAPSLADFFQTWTSPGLSLTVTTSDTSFDDLLTGLCPALVTSARTPVVRTTTTASTWVGCSTTRTAAGSARPRSASPPRPPKVGSSCWRSSSWASEADVAVLDHIVQTFIVTLTEDDAAGTVQVT